MSVIYEPKNRAKEYCDLALNLFNGCTNACKYCFAPNVLRKDKADFHSTCEARKNIVASVKKEASDYKGKEVLLCFTCDPFPNNKKLVEEVTIPVLKILGEAGVIANVLTKNPLSAMDNRDLFVKYGFKLGTTMLFTSDITRKQWEPEAENVLARAGAISYAHSAGVYTWISVEPVIDTEEALGVIQILHEDVDFWKVGKLNGRDEETKAIEKFIDWKKFYYDATALLDSFSAKYYIKKDLREFA